MGIPEGRRGLATVKRGVVLATVIAVAGCATDQRIELAYRAAPTEGQIQAPHVSIYVGPFEDHRTEPETVGVISHGLFESVVRSDIKIRLRRGTVATWVREALTQELELRGYNLVEADDDPEWQVIGSVLELAYREGGWPILTRPSAVLTIECELARDNTTVLRERYWSSTDTSSRPGDPARLLETVLRRDLRKFMEDFETLRKGAADKG